MQNPDGLNSYREPSGPTLIDKLVESLNQKAVNESIANENTKLKKVIEQLQSKLVASFEKEAMIERLVSEIDSSMAIEIQKVLKGETNSIRDSKQQHFRERFTSHKKSFQNPIDDEYKDVQMDEEDNEEDLVSQDITYSVQRGHINTNQMKVDSNALVLNSSNMGQKVH